MIITLSRLFLSILAFVVVILGTNDQLIKPRSAVIFDAPIINVQSDFPAGEDNQNQLQSLLDRYSLSHKEALTRATVHIEWSGLKGSRMARHFSERLLRLGAEPDALNPVKNTGLPQGIRLAYTINECKRLPVHRIRPSACSTML